METLDEFRERILREFDIDLLVEALQIGSEELLDRFEDRLVLKRDEGVFDEPEE